MAKVDAESIGSPNSHVRRSARPPRPALSVRSRLSVLSIASAALAFLNPTLAIDNVYLTEVPDYDWHVGCFGTATGNLFGYWDRHGFPNFYTGPTRGGLAPLDSFGDNRGIRSLWSTEAGLDGRPFSQPGHWDDYYLFYEFTGSDPYQSDGRPEHTPDCSGDFIGLNQRKWSDLGGECSGNIDGYSFNYFDRTGLSRTNYTPSDTSGNVLPDIQSGLRRFSEFRGYAAETASQLSDFNPDKSGTRGFSFADLKAEIDAGYPVLLFMQAFGVFNRELHGTPHVNPIIHGMLAYGYVIDDEGRGYVRYRTSWASGDHQLSAWTAANWTPEQSLNLPLRGVITFHPLPKITGIRPVSGGLRLQWHGPRSILRDEGADQEWSPQRFVVESAESLSDPQWLTVTGPIPETTTIIPECCSGTRYFRVRVTSE